MPAVQVFRYVPELDAFLITNEFKRIAETLGIAEWHEAVWLGRLFMLDNDYGEHWFDNWDEREALTEKAAAMGIDDFDLMVVVPERMANGNDGPCHSPAVRKAFWTDVLKSLTINHDTLFLYARERNESARQLIGEDGTKRPDLKETYITDLEARIAVIQARRRRCPIKHSRRIRTRTQNAF